MSHDDRNDLDIRIADALVDAAATTTTDADALNQIIRRAESAPPRVSGQRVVASGVVAAVVGLGAVGVVVLSPGSSTAPSSTPTVVSAPDPTDVDDDPPDTLPVAGYVEGDLLYDDATLLSQLLVNFGVGGLDDESRMRTAGSPDVAIDHSAMAECMSDRGWQYFAPAGSSWRSALTEHPRFTMEAADFAAQYGLGVAAEALGMLDSEFAPVESELDGYLLSLGPDERQAFHNAEENCAREVDLYHEIAALVPSQAFVNARDYAWTQFEPIVRNDDRVADALATWQECMSAAGFTYDGPELIRTEFARRVFDLDYGPWDFPVDEGTAEYAEIEAIFEEEVAVAVANAACAPPYDEALRGVIVERLPEWKALLQGAIDAGVEGGGAAG